MRRRAFITLLGGLVVAGPRSARTEPANTTIGFLNSQSAGDWDYLAAAVREGLRETGYLEGHNLTIEYRWADAVYDRLPVLAEDLVSRKVAVIVATGASAKAAKAATSTIPIVFTSAEDPVKAGLVESLSHPGGNATGIVLFNVQLAAKRFELLRELVPAAERIAILLNPGNPFSVNEAIEVQEAALASVAEKFRLSRRVARRRSRRPSQPPSPTRPAPSRSARIRCSTAGATGSWRSRPATGCQPCIIGVSSSPQVVS